jgi:hypothetical protein
LEIPRENSFVNKKERNALALTCNALLGANAATLTPALLLLLLLLLLGTSFAFTSPNGASKKFTPPHPRYNFFVSSSSRCVRSPSSTTRPFIASETNRDANKSIESAQIVNDRLMIPFCDRRPRGRTSDIFFFSLFPPRKMRVQNSRRRDKEEEEEEEHKRGRH